MTAGEVHGPDGNRTWWIVLTPIAGELNGVLVDHEANRVHALMGPREKPLVGELVKHADPTVDVSVAHGWQQAPAELRDLHEAKRTRRRR